MTSAQCLLLTVLPFSTLLAKEQAKAQPESKAQAKTSAATSNDSVLKLNELTVEAESPETVVNTNFQTKTLIKETQQAATDGADLLKAQAGFATTSQGGMASDPMLRGLGGSRLNILLDGVPFGGACNHRMDPATAYVKPNSFKAFNVLRGPQSVRYGNTISGAVNFERKPLRFEKAGIRLFGSDLYGSFNKQDLSVESTAGNRWGYLGYSANRARMSSYFDGNGRLVENTGYETWSDRVMLGVTPDADSVIELSALHSDGVIGNGTINMDVTDLNRHSYELHAQKNNINAWLKKAELRFSHTEVGHTMDNFRIRPQLTQRSGIVMGQEWQQNFVKAELTFVPLTDVELTTGFEYRTDSYDANGFTVRTNAALLIPVPDRGLKSMEHILDFENSAAFAELAYQANSNLRLVAGVRGDSLLSESYNMRTGGQTTNLLQIGANSSRRQNLWAGFVRSEYSFDKIPLMASIGYGHASRAADYWEIFSEGAFHLKAEQNNELDGMLIYDGDHYSAELTAFYSRIDDFILIKNGNEALNVDAERWGEEFKLSYFINDALTSYASLAYTHANDLTRHSPLAQTPPLEGRLGLKYKKNAFKAAYETRFVNAQDRIEVDQNAKGIQNQYGNTIALDSSATGGFVVHALQLTYNPDPLFDLTFGIDNLFNKTYAEHLNRQGSGAGAAGPAAAKLNAMGRTIWARLSLDFDY